MDLLYFQAGVTGIASLALILFKVWAFVDALMRPAEAYPAADKLTKSAWLLILGLSAAAAVLFPRPIGLLSILGTVASIVYIVDVRPALVSVTRGRR